MSEKVRNQMEIRSQGEGWRCMLMWGVNVCGEAVRSQKAHFNLNSDNC